MSNNIAIIGGGPSGLFILKKLITSGITGIGIDIYEKGEKLGAGMPYSEKGACEEHITNVSSNEIPELEETVLQWMTKVEEKTLEEYGIELENIHGYRVLPRLLFGQYLAKQFDILLQRAVVQGFEVKVHYQSEVMDLQDDAERGLVTLKLANGRFSQYKTAIICTGHIWSKKNEGKIAGYFDSPYPPAKLKLKVNYPVAIRGASLTAIDAVRTLAREHGVFIRNDDGLTYKLDAKYAQFRLVLHSLDGLLPAIRFHLEESMLGMDTLYSNEEIEQIRAENNGFVPLDLVFDEKFKRPFAERIPEFYDEIKEMQIENFVTHIMSFREKMDAFELFRAEYLEAAKSIGRKESIHWKELLGSLSYTMNYPAKYFSAEDMLRLKKVLMPLISLVIAFVPQGSAEEMLALYEAGVLDLVAVNADSKVEPKEEGGITYQYNNTEGEKEQKDYQLFVDGMGQPHLSFEEFPYQGLRENGSVAPARLRFSNSSVAEKLAAENPDVELDKNGNYYLKVPGIAINDYFQPLDANLEPHSRLYMMAVPLMGGHNPDYSGLDFCDTAAGAIIAHLTKRLAFENEQENNYGTTG